MHFDIDGRLDRLDSDGCQDPLARLDIGGYLDAPYRLDIDGCLCLSDYSLRLRFGRSGVTTGDGQRQGADNRQGGKTRLTHFAETLYRQIRDLRLDSIDQMVSLDWPVRHHPVRQRQSKRPAHPSPGCFADELGSAVSRGREPSKFGPRSVSLRTLPDRCVQVRAARAFVSDFVRARSRGCCLRVALDSSRLWTLSPRLGLRHRGSTTCLPHRYLNGAVGRAILCPGQPLTGKFPHSPAWT